MCVFHGRALRADSLLNSEESLLNIFLERSNSSTDSTK